MDLVSHEFHLGTILYLEIRGGGDFSLAFQVSAESWILFND